MTHLTLPFFPTSQTEEMTQLLKAHIAACDEKSTNTRQGYNGHPTPP